MASPRAYGAPMPAPMMPQEPVMMQQTMQQPTTGHWETVQQQVWVPDPPVVHQEQVMHRHVPVVHEQTVEVPHVQYQERIVEVPHVQTQEVVRHVPVPIVQEREA